MSYYTATICEDGDGAQIIVHWDDLDPNRFIYAPIMVNHPVADDAELASLLASQGWVIKSDQSDNVVRGWAIVSRRDHRFYDPISQDWHVSLADDRKRAIRTLYPDARVPGTE